MPKYECSVKVTYNTVVIVDAKDKEEAREKINNGDWEHADPIEAADWGPARTIKEV